MEDEVSFLKVLYLLFHIFFKIIMNLITLFGLVNLIKMHMQLVGM